MKKLSTAQRKLLMAANNHKLGRVIGGDPRTRENLADAGLIEVYGHHFGPLYQITESGKKLLQGK